jgi:hypothetical protein
VKGQNFWAAPMRAAPATQLNRKCIHGCNIR